MKRTRKSKKTALVLVCEEPDLSNRKPAAKGVKLSYKGGDWVAAWTNRDGETVSRSLGSAEFMSRDRACEFTYIIARGLRKIADGCADLDATFAAAGNEADAARLAGRKVQAAVLEGEA